MKYPFIGTQLPFCVALALALTGCVSTKYKAAPKETPPPVKLNLAGESPQLGITLDSVIIFRGPGSWKREAYWDEYVVTLTNRSGSPLTLEAVELVDLVDATQAPGDDPWALEKASRVKIKQLEDRGRKVLLGAGWGTLWVGSVVVTGGAMFGGGSAAVVAGGSAVIVGLPVLGIGTWIRSAAAKDDIAKEFTRRRLILPVVLEGHSARSGSLFYPISPGPKRLILRHRFGGAHESITIDLAPLAGLHLPPDGAKRRTE